jgi:hypothetical protein
VTPRQQYAFGLLVGRARARHGTPLPARMKGAFMVGCHVGLRQIVTGRQR